MMFTRLVKRQLVAFGVVTVGVLAVLMLDFVQLPAILGFGRFEVKVNLAEAGGLYPRANVSYRGEEVGVVTAVQSRPGGGARVLLQIDDDVDIPRSSQVQVRSVSALGEQYVDFVPDPNQAAFPKLKSGDVVDESQTLLPTSTRAVLVSVDELLRSIPQDDLTTTLNELGIAFGTAGDSIGRLFDSANELTLAATKNLDQTQALVDGLPSVLETQQDLRPSIREYAKSLELLTGQLSDSDDDLRQLLRVASPTLREFSATSKDLRPIAPVLLTDLYSGGRVLKAYRPGIEQILTVLPPSIVSVLATVYPNLDNQAAGHDMMNLWFKANLGDPPACTQGYADARHERSPYSDVGPAPIPLDSYCKVAHEDPRVVRGARNAPCPNDPSKRAATAAECGLIFDRRAVR